MATKLQGSCQSLISSHYGSGFHERPPTLRTSPSSFGELIAALQTPPLSPSSKVLNAFATMHGHDSIVEDAQLIQLTCSLLEDEENSADNSAENKSHTYDIRDEIEDTPYAHFDWPPDRIAEFVIGENVILEPFALLIRDERIDGSLLSEISFAYLREKMVASTPTDVLRFLQVVCKLKKLFALRSASPSLNKDRNMHDSSKISRNKSCADYNRSVVYSDMPTTSRGLQNSYQKLIATSQSPASSPPSTVSDEYNTNQLGVSTCVRIDWTPDRLANFFVAEDASFKPFALLIRNEHIDEKLLSHISYAYLRETVKDSTPADALRFLHLIRKLKKIMDSSQEIHNPAVTQTNTKQKAF